ncbi:hypothetical protein ACFQVB_22510 [Paraburkholderia humisilvae]|uniref:hypothetical protein n=1 Tax=Paraburkholderia humisilvae TaxID=627669 RepID=UPI003618959A
MSGRAQRIIRTTPGGSNDWTAGSRNGTPYASRFSSTIVDDRPQMKLIFYLTLSCKASRTPGKSGVIVVSKRLARQRAMLVWRHFDIV